MSTLQSPDQQYRPATFKMDNDLYLWGDGTATRTILNFIDTKLFHNIKIVNPDDVSINLPDVLLAEKIDIHQFVSETHNRSNYVVVPTGYLTERYNITYFSPNFESRFLGILRKWRYLYRFPMTRLRHPVALFPVMRPDLSDNYYIYGCQSSGNVLTRQLILECLNGRVTLSESSQLIRAIAKNYSDLLTEALSDRLDSLGCWDLGLVPSHFNHADAQIMRETSTSLFIYNLPLPLHLVQDTLITHSTLYESDVQELLRTNVHLLFTVRNPLSTVVSLSGKGKPKERKLDDLRDPAWFRNRMDYVTRFLAHLRTIKEHAPVFRYEDLLADPIGAITAMVDKLGLPSISSSVAEALWDKIGFKTLPIAPRDHFWQGGVDRWDGVLTDEHFAIAREAGLGDIMEAFGYEPPKELVGTRYVAPSTEPLAPYMQGETAVLDGRPVLVSSLLNDQSFVVDYLRSGSFWDLVAMGRLTSDTNPTKLGKMAAFLQRAGGD